MRHSFAFVFLLLGLAPAAAQMVLPGAVEPTPAGAAVAPPAVSAPRKKARTAGAAGGGEHLPAATAKILDPKTLAGQTLWRNGRKGSVSFAATDRGISVDHLTLAGEKISMPQEECAVEIADTPLAVSDIGHPAGVARIGIALPACPISFDVLDGAVLATGGPPSCQFKSADCQVHVDGLWGPQPNALGPDKAKALERALTQAEAAVRSNFKRLVAETKDRVAVMGFARDQAGFSSIREVTCREYAGESRHGFCATRLTEARAAALKTLSETLPTDQRKHRPLPHGPGKAAKLRLPSLE